MLEVDDIMKLLEFILTTTYFCFNGQIYRQNFGTAMGSPVFPLAANMFMEHLERKHLDRRFETEIMEKVCGLLSRGCKDRLDGKLTTFLNELDDSHNINFTYEVEQSGQLPFLDLLLNRTENGCLKLQIYRKPTHTDQYLNFSSHHPIEHKLSVVRTLLERSQCLVTKIEGRKEEDFHVEKAGCGYPKLSTK